MGDRPFFTVAVPTWNRSGLLAQTLRALLNQTFGDFELLVSDNHSDDDTPHVVASFQDPRIRYVRQDRNIGGLANFLYLMRNAAGRFIVINQDDDLLHRDFLRRCHACVSADPSVKVFAAPLWNGHEQSGFKSTLMPNLEHLTPDYIINDETAVIDGKRAAVSFLYGRYIFMPAVVMCAATLAEIGGFLEAEEVMGNDTITICRMICRGRLAYDPRPGGILRVHGANTYRDVFSHDQRIRYGCLMFHQMITDFDVYGIDWRGILAADLARYPEKRVVEFAKQWIRYDAPAPLQRVGVEAVRRHRQQAGPAFWAWLNARLGLRKTLHYHYRQRWPRDMHMPRPPSLP